MKYEKVSTGNIGLDEVINYLRIGDNVVWQVDQLQDYMEYAKAYAQASLANKRKVVYIRFADHAPIFEEQEGTIKYVLDPSSGFESFTIQVHHIIEKEGLETFYVFDCLSNLLEAWATDLMIGNFFQVTCPYLFEMDTIAYFAIIRGGHSFETIARIRETTQLLLDVYNIEEKLYFHPLKVWNRYSPTMFLPHIQSGQKLTPVTSSAEAASLFRYLPEKGLGNAKRHLDYWDKLFMGAEDLIFQGDQESDMVQQQKKEVLEQLSRLIIGKEKKVLDLAREYFTLEDILAIKSRLIGSGFIGGKAVGMLLARQILYKSDKGRWGEILEPHDSFYIGSDVFYTYLVQNGWWRLRLHQRSPEGYFNAAEVLGKKMKYGFFPETIKEQFLQMLEYFGQSPIIVRSSSLLEDSFGNAFAGKYESVFCVNQGTPAERYEQFEMAIKTIYASAMNQDALEYRKKRGLDQADEQMAILVQRVSGDYYKKYFFPFLAGVGFSYNNYVWKEDLDPKAGMIRLVLGLGTKAVNRVEGDYPMVASLDRPTLRPIGSVEDVKKYSQNTVDLLNVEKNRFESIDLNKLMWEKTGIQIDLIGIYDHDTNQKIREYRIQEQEAWILTYEKLFRYTEFIQIMKDILKALEQAYTYPVDIEFTVNYLSDQKLRVNLVQCRPLQTKGTIGRVQIPAAIEDSKVILATKGHFMGGSMDQEIHRILYIDPAEYSALSTQDKFALTRVIGQMNKMVIDREKMAIMLVAPGRIGSSTPSLGLPISFSDISNMSVLCETAYEVMGMVPDLSYGSHFFQDLIEEDIFYVSIFPNMKETIFDTAFFQQSPNVLLKLLPDAAKFQQVLKVIDRKEQIWMKADMQSQRLKCFRFW